MATRALIMKMANKMSIESKNFEQNTRKTKMLAANMPVGNGFMHFIPVENAILADSKVCSYEEISYYIENANMIAVTDNTYNGLCSEEDMSIQINEVAEHFFSTGKSRQITKDEAYKILLQAENDGLLISYDEIEESRSLLYFPWDILLSMALFKKIAKN